MTHKKYPTIQKLHDEIKLELATISTRIEINTSNNHFCIIAKNHTTVIPIYTWWSCMSTDKKESQAIMSRSENLATINNQLNRWLFRQNLQAVNLAF